MTDTPLLLCYLAIRVVLRRLDEDLLQAFLADPVNPNDARGAAIRIRLTRGIDRKNSTYRRNRLTRYAGVVKLDEGHALGIEVCHFRAGVHGEATRDRISFIEPGVNYRWVRGQRPSGLKSDGMRAWGGSGHGVIITATTDNCEHHESCEPPLHAASEVGETSWSTIAANHEIDKRDGAEPEPWQAGDL